MPEAHAGLVYGAGAARAPARRVRRGRRGRRATRRASSPRKIGRTIPLVYGVGGLGAVAAMRWKQSMNENAKAPAFWNQYPELDHNEICGWGQHGDVTRQVFTLVELRHGFEHPRLVRPLGRGDPRAHRGGRRAVLEVEAGGEGRLAQLLDLIYVGDWTSCYLALDHDVDPGPIDAITQLKTQLGGSAGRVAAVPWPASRALGAVTR